MEVEKDWNQNPLFLPRIEYGPGNLGLQRLAVLFSFLFILVLISDLWFLGSEF